MDALREQEFDLGRLRQKKFALVTGRQLDHNWVNRDRFYPDRDEWLIARLFLMDVYDLKTLPAEQLKDYHCILFVTGSLSDLSEKFAVFRQATRAKIVLVISPDGEPYFWWNESQAAGSSWLNKCDLLLTFCETHARYFSLFAGVPVVNLNSPLAVHAAASLVKPVEQRKRRVLLAGFPGRGWNGLTGLYAVLPFGLPVDVLILDSGRQGVPRREEIISLYREAARQLNCPLTILPRVPSYPEHLQRLAGYYLGIIMDAYACAGGICGELASVGVPVVGSNTFEQQRICFPELALAPFDGLGAREAVRRLLADPNFYERVAAYARQKKQAANYSRTFALLKEVFLYLLSLNQGKPVFLSAPVQSSPPSAVVPAAGVNHLMKTSQYDVIFFPVIDWELRFQRPQHLACGLAENGHRVFYLRTTFRANAEFPLVRLLKENIYEVELPYSRPVNVYREQMDAVLVEKACAAIDFLRREWNLPEVVCIVQLPFWTPLVQELKKKYGWKIVYDCLDRHDGFSTNGAAMLAQEEKLARLADLVVTTSQRLREEKKELNQNCLLIRNAADFAHFAAFFGQVPLSLQGLAKPVIGYFGAISEWFDGELIEYLAQKRPGYSFVLIGSTYGADIQNLAGLPNVYLFGELPYQKLPGYLHTFDVCLIPFKVNPLTEATDPVKFYEYLSAGKPVVSVPLPELLPYQAEGLVYLAGTAEGFLEAIEAALAENTPEKMERRRHFARRNNWAIRVAALKEAVKKTFPLVSIIVVTHNNLHLNEQCLNSIYRCTTYPNFELIVVDNASTDGTLAYLQETAGKAGNLKLVPNDRNIGFAKGVNAGIKAAGGEYVVILNNDTVVTRGWLGRLIRYLERDQTIGMVGPVTNLAGNEARIETHYSSLEEMEQFAERHTREHENESFPVDTLAMFCVAMRKSLFTEVGLLDERFAIGMFEDDDFALRVRNRGYKIICAEDVFVHHFHNASFKLMGEQRFREIFEANRRRYEEKWGIKWKPHRYR